MRKISEKDKLFYYERSFFTLDGFWMVVTEEYTDFKTALKIDLEVWKRLLTTIIRRLKRYLKIKSNNVDDIVEILSFRWSVEGWDYEVIEKNIKKGIVQIKHCPYKAILDRSENRKNKIPHICKDICIPLYEEAVESFNPKIRVKRPKQMGLGDNYCEFIFERT